MRAVSDSSPMKVEEIRAVRFLEVGSRRKKFHTARQNLLSKFTHKVPIIIIAGRKRREIRIRSIIPPVLKPVPLPILPTTLRIATWL